MRFLSPKILGESVCQEEDGDEEDKGGAAQRCPEGHADSSVTLQQIDDLGSTNISM